MGDMPEQFVRVLHGVGLWRRGCPEAQAARAAADAPVDDRVERPERASANEENIRGVDLNEVLVRVLAPDLVDLVDVDDAPLGLRNIEVRRLDQSQKYVLDVLAYVARLS